jgi:predicted MFS family arabinose efflux permease
VVAPRLGELLASLRELAFTHPVRAAGVALTSFVAAFGTMPSFQFSGYYTQSALGWDPHDYAQLVIVGGGVGIIGNIVGGRLGDSWGRKRVGFAMLFLFPLASFGFYRGPTWVVAASWVALVFCSMGGRVIARAFAAELFPTSQRGASSGMYAALEALGAVAGLLAVYKYGVNDVRDYALAVPLVATTIWIAALVLLRFPETRQRELEEIG